MGNRFVWKGLVELREELRQLPEHLRGQATAIATDAAESAADEVRTNYPEESGDLADSVEVVPTSKNVGQFGVGLTVVASAWYAWIFEVGTEAPRQTAKGWDRGKMPAGKVFIPAMIKWRRVMMRRLKGLLQDTGLRVTGDDGGL